MLFEAIRCTGKAYYYWSLIIRRHYKLKLIQKILFGTEFNLSYNMKATAIDLTGKKKENNKYENNINELDL